MSRFRLTGTAGNLGTLVNDLVAEITNQHGRVDLYDFVATRTYGLQSAGCDQCRCRQQWLGRSSSPAPARTPFTNTGNYRVQDNRTDVPATARGVDRVWRDCDAQRRCMAPWRLDSTVFTVQNTALTSGRYGQAPRRGGRRQRHSHQSSTLSLYRLPTRCTAD